MQVFWRWRAMFPANIMVGTQGIPLDQVQEFRKLCHLHTIINGLGWWVEVYGFLLKLLLFCSGRPLDDLLIYELRWHIRVVAIFFTLSAFLLFCLYSILSFFWCSKCQSLFGWCDLRRWSAYSWTRNGVSFIVGWWLQLFLLGSSIMTHGIFPFVFQWTFLVWSLSDVSLWLFLGLYCIFCLHGGPGLARLLCIGVLSM